MLVWRVCRVKDSKAADDICCTYGKADVTTNYADAGEYDKSRMVAPDGDKVLIKAPKLESED